MMVGRFFVVCTVTLLVVCNGFSTRRPSNMRLSTSRHAATHSFFQREDIQKGLKILHSTLPGEDASVDEELEAMRFAGAAFILFSILFPFNPAHKSCLLFDTFFQNTQTYREQIIFTSRLYQTGNDGARQRCRKRTQRSARLLTKTFTA